MPHHVHERIHVYSKLSDSDLLSAVENNTRVDRNGAIELVASLAELDVRGLYRGLGYSSLYAYCTQHLHLSEHEARTRMEAARAAWRFPMVLDMLVAGDLTMTTAAILRPWLTDENCVTLLEAARKQTKREVEILVADLGEARPSNSTIFAVPGGFRVEITIDHDTHGALRRLQELLRHGIPSGDPAEIVSLALKSLLRSVERRRLADVQRPRTTELRVSHTRHIPAAVKRAVWARDKSRCAFVGTEGRCRERTMLQVHHLVPFSRGGLTSVENLQLRCRTHNIYEVELQESGSK